MDAAEWPLGVGAGTLAVTALCSGDAPGSSSRSNDAVMEAR